MPIKRDAALVTAAKGVAGRPAGSENQKTKRRREIALEILNGPITPLQIMWDMARGRRKFDAEILEACKACAPYVHPKLQMIHMTGRTTGMSHEQALNQLDDDESPLVNLAPPPDMDEIEGGSYEVVQQLTEGQNNEEDAA